jgi:multidrug efflux pump subunit AcrB
VLGVIALAALVLSFRSVSLAALVTVVAVLSAGLGLLALRIGGYPLGFNAIIGTSGLAGVAINGAIVVLAAIRSVPAARAAEPLAMVAAVRDSTRHVVATSLTTAGGFLPLLLFTGGDFWPPLAIVLAGGVLLSVPLALLFTPAAYRLMVGRTRARHVDLGPQQTTIQYAEA